MASYKRSLWYTCNTRRNVKTMYPVFVTYQVCFRIPISIKVWWIEGEFPWMEGDISDSMGIKLETNPSWQSEKNLWAGQPHKTSKHKGARKGELRKGGSVMKPVFLPGVVGLGGNCYPVIEANSGSSLSFKADYLAAHSQTIHWTRGHISYIWMHFLRGICGYIQSTLSTSWPLNHITVHPIRNTDFSDANVMMDSWISAATKTPKQKLAQHHEILQT